MLQTALDDSGKDGLSPAFVLAGYFGSVDDLMDLAHAWDALLKKEPKLNYVKGYEAFGRQGQHEQFAGWTEKERDDRLLEFVALIAKYPLKGVAFVIDHKPFALIKDLPDDDGTSFHDPPEFAYVASFSTLLQSLPEFGEDRIDIVCDRDLITRRQAERAYARMYSIWPPEITQRLFRREPHWEDDKQFLPLQAADLLAYCVRAEREPTERGDKVKRSSVLPALHSIPTFLSYVDEEQMQYLQDRAKKHIPRQSIFKSRRW